MTNFSSDLAKSLQKLSFNIFTTDNCVVKQHEGDEGGVEDGEGDQQVVERVGHLLRKENFLGKVESST